MGTLRRSRQLAVTVTIIVALGVGTCVSVLSLLHHLVVGSRPFATPETLVVVKNYGAYERPSGKRENAQLSWLDYQDTVAQQHSFVAMGSATSETFATLDTGTRARTTGQVSVTPGLLTPFGVRATRGRLLVAGDFVPGAPPVMLITTALWQHHLGSEPDIVGRTVHINGQIVSIAGVVEDDVVAFQRQRSTLFDRDTFNGCVIVPLVPGGHGEAAKRQAKSQSDRAEPMVTVFGRLRLGATVKGAKIEFRGIGQQLARSYPATNKGRSLGVEGWSQWHVANMDYVLPLLWAVAVLSLVVACASAVGLVVADAIRREPEMAVRHALGASYGRLTVLVLRRSLMWTIPGGAMGLLLAWVMLRWVAPSTPGANSMVDLPFGLDMILVAAGLTLVAAVVLSLVGVRVLRQQNLTIGLKEASAGVSAGRGQRFVLGTIVWVQLTAAMAVGLASGMLLHSMASIIGTDVGFGTGDSFLVRLVIPEGRYTDPAAEFAYFDRVLTTVRSLPGIASAALSNAPPLSNAVASMEGLSIELPGRARRELSWQSHVRVSSGYFDAAMIPIVSGRAFSEAETRTGTPVFIVDEEFCRQNFSGVDPQQVVLRFGETPYPIVGVAKRVRSFGPLERVLPTIYAPWGLSSYRRTRFAHVVVRPSGPPAAVMTRVLQELVRIDPHVVINDPETYRTLYGKRIEDRTRTLRLVTLASLIVLLLTAFSISGALGEFVAHKQRELAVRKALGASPLNVMWLVGRYLAVPAIGGMCCGAVGGWALARTLSSQLVGVEPTDLATIVATMAAQLAIGAVAAFGSIRRAMAVDPATTLRGL
jgi:putative ABC transport system permease protein